MSIEIEKKYVIMMPDTDALSLLPEYTRSEITQIYLSSGVGESHRIRKRSSSHGTSYTETKKLRIDKMSSHENEREISEAEYTELLAERDLSCNIIEKVRHTFRFDDRTIEIDIYPEWKSSCIMEIELPSRDTVPKLPDFIKIIRDVTGIRGYSNHAMSREFPKEIC